MERARANAIIPDGTDTVLLFIVGTGRCGSTMMQEVLARHPDMGFISNFDANLRWGNSKGRWNNALYRLTPAGAAQRDVRHLRIAGRPLRFGPSESYPMLNRRVSSMVSEPARDLVASDVTPWLEQRLRSFFGERIEAQRKRVFLCKFAGWPRARFLHQIFPQARFLQMVRDGRAVADSLVRRPWWKGHRGPAAWGFGPLPATYERQWDRSGRSFVVLAGLQWAMLMDAFEEARADISDDLWMQVRYEDFIDRPRDHMERVLGFAGVDWPSAFERRFTRYHFDPSRKHEYVDNLTPSQLRLLSEVLRPHLERYGYASSDGIADAVAASR